MAFPHRLELPLQRTSTDKEATTLHPELSLSLSLSLSASRGQGRKDGGAQMCGLRPPAAAAATAEGLLRFEEQRVREASRRAVFIGGGAPWLLVLLAAVGPPKTKKIRVSLRPYQVEEASELLWLVLAHFGVSPSCHLSPKCLAAPVVHSFRL